MNGNGRESGGMWLEVGASTHKGRVRHENQDAYLTMLPPVTPPGVAGVLAVADGMGGHQGGATASRIAIETMAEWFGQKPADADATMTSGSTVGSLSAAIRRANTRIREQAASPDLAGMGTTITVASISDRALSIGHVGDSRAYIMRNGVVSQFTRDHAWISDEVAAGNLTAEQAAIHPRKSLLSRAVGATDDVDVDEVEVELETGDVVVLCSDGLHGRVDDSDMAEVVSRLSPSRAARELVNMANEAGGQDNITVVVAKVRDQEPTIRRFGRLLRWSKPMDVVTG
ncbi:MAG: Stp1/IreP family PP2C-type Ser/Thr phosphatase [Chloroflexi bacterium]|nr:Stp1/IreP family PP2C-type Ser/Thr phosphatase [Chloroflexota bacterium]